MATAFSRWADAALDLLAPRDCLSCGGHGQERAGLCSVCERRLRPAPRDPCFGCGAPLRPGADPDACIPCAVLRPKFRGAVAVGPYAGFLGELIRRAKYGRDPVLAAPLAELLAGAVRAWSGRDGV